MEPLAAVGEDALKRPVSAVGDDMSLQPRGRGRGLLVHFALGPQASVLLLGDLRLGVSPNVIQEVAGV